MKSSQPPSLWSGQLLHFLALPILLSSTFYVWIKIGMPSPFLFWFAIAIPIVHQIFVWLSWRMELKSGATSRSIGFKTYLILFFVLLVCRPISILFLAWSDQGTLGCSELQRTIISAVLFIPALFTIYSVRRYFSFTRAAGADHFNPKYRKMPLVKKGIFKYSSNSMYVFGFMIFWAFAVVFDSSATLLASAFGHLYIWIHYFATEKPDMNYLYGQTS